MPLVNPLPKITLTLSLQNYYSQLSYSWELAVHFALMCAVFPWVGTQKPSIVYTANNLSPAPIFFFAHAPCIQIHLSCDLLLPIQNTRPLWSPKCTPKYTPNPFPKPNYETKNEHKSTSKNYTYHSLQNYYSQLSYSWELIRQFITVTVTVL